VAVGITGMINCVELRAAIF